MKSTHWHHIKNPEDWTDGNPGESLEVCALAAFQADDDDGWELREDMKRDGNCLVTLHGFIETDEPLGPDEAFDGYEPGDSYFKQTGEVTKVMVTLNFRPLDAAKEKV